MLFGRRLCQRRRGGGSGGPGNGGGGRHTLPMATGGIGRRINITGSPVYYAGGGAGGHGWGDPSDVPGTIPGSLGGGGNGSFWGWDTGTGGDATFYGSGGGGGGAGYTAGGSGYQGVVVVRYRLRPCVTIHSAITAPATPGIVSTPAVTVDGYVRLAADAAHLKAWYKFDDSLHDSVGVYNLSVYDRVSHLSQGRVFDVDAMAGKSSTNTNMAGFQNTMAFDSLMRTNFTISSWIKLKRDSVNYFVLFDSRHSGTSGFAIYVVNIAPGPQKIVVAPSQTSSEYTYITTARINDAKWHHVALTFVYGSETTDGYEYTVT